MNLSPDYRFGWGLMNTLKASQAMTNNAASGYFKWRGARHRPHIYDAVITGTGAMVLKIACLWLEIL